ncbi:Hypothetical protein R9X50_00293600 [Acrodontium crateriforme]|uniref:Carboxylic ester hydrolase n=1 Tax=Acrodontium crateriforme TaxID=150365 RepID=A0AAQ3M4U6_9PEZI|nr:Hypothetical protein R9X50_00293600 [Acrodontium crateriforme]
MQWTSLFWFLMALPVDSTFECTEEAFQAILPSNATVAFTRTLAENSTFEVPIEDIAYPISPTQLRALCAVQVNVTSSPTSAFSFGLFLPDDWNSRFLVVGNGGFSGGINWLDMGAGLEYGFAVMSTDTGHNASGGDITWALNLPEKKIDFGYRAMHGSTVLAKHIVEAYYATVPKYNYFSGCSTGGRQGLKEVEMFPDDFDGVLAGAPAWWTSHLQPWTVKLGLLNLPLDAPHHIPPILFPIIGDEVLKQCDHQDGVLDQIISDPRGCEFNAEALLCESDVVDQLTDRCLTASQIETVKKIYNDYVEVDETFVFPRLELGSEEHWDFGLGRDQPSKLGTEYVKYFLLDDPDWDFYDYGHEIVEMADKLQPGNATVVNFDFSPFQKKGGKLLQYHGMSDALIPTGSSVYLYEQVLAMMKPKGIPLDDWFRFFLVPGGLHCSGSPANMNAPWYFAGANQAGDLGQSPGTVSGARSLRNANHDALLALMAWTENGTAPDHIIATKWNDDATMDRISRQRPLCPYPQFAILKGGSSDPNDPSAWSCTTSDERGRLRVQSNSAGPHRIL